MSVYAPSDAVVAYDIVPPLQYVGKEAYRKDYEVFLAQYDGPIDIEYRDLAHRLRVVMCLSSRTGKD